MANKIKEYREKKGLSQEELAEITQTHIELVKAIEDGRAVSIPMFQAEVYAQALNAKPSELFDAVGDYDAATTVSEQDDDLSDKLENFESVCTVAAEELDALMNTLFQARVGLERSNYAIAEFKMLYTVEIALESIIRDLEQACR